MSSIGGLYLDGQSLPIPHVPHGLSGILYLTGRQIECFLVFLPLKNKECPHGSQTGENGVLVTPRGVDLGGLLGLFRLY